MKAVWTVNSIIVYLIIATVFILNSQFSQEAFAAGMHQHDLSSNDHCDGAGGAPSDLSSNDHCDGAGGAPSDLSSNGSSGSYDGGGKFWHNGQDIAMELSSLTPAEIRTYPLNDLSNNDIRLVLGFLSPSNLTKVLLNISQENLLHIRDALTPVTFDQIINKLSETDKINVENRLSVVPIN